MTTLNDWIIATRDHLLSGLNEELNQLATSIGPDDEEITVKRDATAIAPNTDICIGLETIHVWEQVSDKIFSVERGWKGRATNHLANDIIYVSTAYSPYRIAHEINNELRALNSRGLYGIGVDILTYSSSTQTIPFEPEPTFRSVLEFRRMTPDIDDWPQIGGSLVRHLPDDISDTPYGIRFEPGAAADGDTIAITYKKDFNCLETLNDDIFDTGITESMQDILPLGAAIRIVLPREIRRNNSDSQSEPRRQNEVPVGSVAQSARQLKTQYDERIAYEKKSLNENYALRKNRMKNAAILLNGMRNKC